MSAFGRLAQKGNTILLPANVGDPAAMVAQALAVFDNIRKSQKIRETEHDTADNEEAQWQHAEDTAAFAATTTPSLTNDHTTRTSTPAGDETFTPKPWDTKA